MGKGYFKKENYDINTVLSQVVDIPDVEPRIDFDGDLIKMNSMRYKVFKKHGTVCADCGLKGLYFTKETNHLENPELKYHFNLYGRNNDNEEVLFCKWRIHNITNEKKVDSYLTICEECASIRRKDMHKDDKKTYGFWRAFQHIQTGKKVRLGNKVYYIAKNCNGDDAIFIYSIDDDDLVNGDGDGYVEGMFLDIMNSQRWELLE